MFDPDPTAPMLALIDDECGMGVDQQCVAGVRGEGHDENLAVTIDASASNKCSGWAESFIKELDTAGLKLESATAPAVGNESQFRTRVEAAAALYKAGVRTARSRLENVRNQV